MEDPEEVEFDALEYGADDRFHPAHLRFESSPRTGWRVLRGGRLALELGPGYRLLRSETCGVCSTDLARRFLPFPLPQVTGHELVARDGEGRRYVVEINASHAARGLKADCPFCENGLATHCPERLVLGIHDLPGGFGPWVLVPIRAALELSPRIPDEVAVLVEPFAAVTRSGADEDYVGQLASKPRARAVGRQPGRGQSRRRAATVASTSSTAPTPASRSGGA